MTDLIGQYEQYAEEFIVKPVFYNYFRSSASYRVRIALSLKGIPFNYLPIHLNRNGGEQFSPEYRSINPQSLVPVFVEGSFALSQSLAIIEYLDEKFPQPPLLPKAMHERAHSREIALTIACDIHPLNNLRVLKALTGEFGLTEDAKHQWIARWIESGFGGVETLLSQSNLRGRFCIGDLPTLADCCLVPQIFNARRFGVDMSHYPTLEAIEAECMKLDAFRAAHPVTQPDSER
ncbi:maleylacetoacetate isomerase [Paraburkholderia sediminicola]|uniref:maleylacetoacetate isomerase n=1 Tax=Paraburkholderia sediminicola TaxID=458836 RepID=UPI0038B9F217